MRVPKGSKGVKIILLLEQLKEMCRQPEDGKAYYRPLICNGEFSNIDIFFVGTNPATPIFPEDLDLDSYVNLLLVYEKFIDYYKSRRLENGKDEFSRTRIGMNSFLRWLAAHTDKAIAETEVIPYPTAKLKELKREPRYILQKGLDMFYSLVCEFTPRLLILHGKKTVDWTIDMFSQKELIPTGAVDLDNSIEQMETRLPLLQFTYPSGKIGTILACRHFMYYGTKGESFKGFRDNVLAVVREPIG